MNTDLGEYLREFIVQFGAGGGVDLPDCAVGSVCAQTDIDAANFIKNVQKKYPSELKDINAKLQIVQKNSSEGYGWVIGVDADGIVHTYKGVPIEKILNIWNYGTGDGKVDRKQFWSSSIRKLRGKYQRSEDRFFDILDRRYEGKSSHAKNSGGNITSKVNTYMSHKGEYMSQKELNDVEILKKKEVELNKG